MSKVVHGIPVLDGDESPLNPTSAFHCPRCSFHGVWVGLESNTYLLETSIRTIEFRCYCHGCQWWTNLFIATLDDGPRSATWFFTKPKQWVKYTAE